jgi:hypothetical protein
MSHQKGAFRTARMLPVATELCVPDVIDDHVPDFIRSVLLAEKVAGESRCRDFRSLCPHPDGSTFPWLHQSRLVAILTQILCKFN